MPCIEMYSGFEVLMKRDNNSLEDIDYSKEIGLMIMIMLVYSKYYSGKGIF